eukprot:44687_1
MGNTLCTCNHPNYLMERSIQNEAKAKFQRSRAYQDIEQQRLIAAKRIELESELDKERHQFAVMKRAYDTMKFKTDTNVKNKQIVRMLSEEKEQYEQELIGQRKKSEALCKDIEKYKNQLNEMESQLAVEMDQC